MLALMSYQIDYSELDQPHILMFVFHPREDWAPLPPGATDHMVPVGEGISISCRFYPVSESSPSILFFHGNGEAVYDYDGIAPLYNRLGINFFVADYRGYGQSNGSPSFSSTISDAHVIFNYFRDTLQNYTGPLFIMGRSLGSFSAIELASKYPELFNGMIIESGFSSAGRLLTFLIPIISSSSSVDLEQADLEKIRSITLPTLIMHGEYDEIIPHEQAEIIYKNVGSQNRKLLTIPGAGHNDMLLIGIEQYFSAIREFVNLKSP